MKKILFLITKSEIGGAQKWTKEQIDICRDKFICYLGTNKEGWLTANTNVEKVLINERIEQRISFGYLLQLIRFVQKNQIDIVIASSANAGIYARLLKFFKINLKVVYVSHGWSAIYSGKKLKSFYTFVEKTLSHLSDSVLCVSKYDYFQALKTIGIRRSKLKHISNCIIPIKNRNLLKKNTSPKIISVSRLSPPKRIDLLIDAVKDVGVELHIVGDGELLNSLKKIAGNNVFFHGEVNNFESFQDFDIFCLISESEGLPLSALEAMSCGLPLVLSQVGGCNELISGNGTLVANDPNHIKAAILDNIGELEDRRDMSFELFDKYFNLHINKNKFLTYYDNL